MMNRGKRGIWHNAQWKIYAVDACFLLMAVTATRLGRMQADSFRAADTAIVASDEGIAEQTQKNVATGVTERTAVYRKPVVTAEDKTEKNDQDILMRIAMAEAGSESTEGKALVMRVVLNRVRSNQFPNSVYEVVHQNGQFDPVANGEYEKANPDEDCQRAYDMILQGWDESNGALYFASTDYEHNWHKDNLTYLFTMGHRDFYR